MSIADDIFDQVQIILADGKVDIGDFVALTGITMKIAQTFLLPGAEKKVVVTNVLKRLVAETDLPDELQAAADLFIEHALPLLIDGLKAAAQGAFDLVKQNCCL